MFSTLVQMFDDRVASAPDAPCQMGKDKKGAFIPVTFSKLQERSRALALALSELGVKRGDAVGLLSDNRPEWLASDLAVLSLGAADVPRGRDAMPYEIEHILKVTKASVVFVENDELMDKLSLIRTKLESLKTVILFDGVREIADAATIHYSDLLRRGIELLSAKGGKERIEKEIALGKEDDTATIIFTSGTTGLPKGVMLSHRNMLYQLGEIDKIVDFQKGWKWLSVLPVWHAFERIVQYVSLYEHSILAYSKPIGKIMLTDIQRINPELLCSVPRIWETVKAGVYQTLKAKKPAEQKIFSFFLSAAKRYRHYENLVLGLEPKFRKSLGVFDKIRGFIPYIVLKGIYSIGDKAAFSQIKSKFGTSFVAGISGGGAMSKDVEEFFSAIGIKLLNGYGMTETAPVVGVAEYPHSKHGFMHTFAGTELKVLDTETREVLPPGEKGELLIRGPQVMKGYFNDEERTRQIIDRDGFIHTGDLAVLDIDGDFSIVGRVKDTIVLSGGENIEPVPIENTMKESEYIDTAVVIGQDEKYLGALIVINEKNVERYLKENHVPYINRDMLAEMDEVRRLINSEISRYVSSEAGFKPYEQVSRFAILDKPFVVGRELSAKQEVKRAEVMKLYRKEIETIFG